MYVKKIKNELKNVSLRHRAAKLYYLYKYIFIYKIGIALSSNFHILLFKKKKKIIKILMLSSINLVHFDDHDKHDIINFQNKICIHEKL